jgi:hypothetical protein
VSPGHNCIAALAEELGVRLFGLEMTSPADRPWR